MNHPTHEEISQRAHHLWQNSAVSGGDATQNWLDAERELTLGSSKSPASAATAERADSHLVSESDSTRASAERSALQKKEARQPILPTHTGPKSAPAESGKPLWNQPHSS